MKFKHTPLQDKVVIIPDPVESVTAGGIIIPEHVKEKPLRGTVVASNKNSELKEGDKVIYKKHVGSEITIDGKTYLLMKDDDILLKEV